MNRNMKIAPEHFDYMRTAITPLDTIQAREQYKAAGLSDKRYRWDLLRAAHLIPWICENLYHYMNDAHIDTALRHIVSPLTDHKETHS